MIELAVLDIAGTTVDEGGRVYRVMADAVRAAGGSPGEDDVAHWMGADKRAAITGLLTGAAGVEPDEDVVDAAVADFRQRLDAAYTAEPPTPIAGVPEALARLREAGVRVALSTGFDRFITDSVLGKLDWDEHLPETVVCVDDVAAGRPAPYLIFRAMERLGVTDVSRVLAAGDTVRDLRAGNNAGAGMVVGVLSGGHEATTLGRCAHTHLLPSVAGLPELVTAERERGPSGR